MRSDPGEMNTILGQFCHGFVTHTCPFLSDEQTCPEGECEGGLLGGGECAAWKCEKVPCKLEGRKGFQTFSVLQEISSGEGAAICKSRSEQAVKAPKP